MEFQTLFNKKLIRPFSFIVLILIFFIIIFNVHFVSSKQTLIRKLEEEKNKSNKIFEIIIMISYIVFIVMDLLFIILAACASKIQELIFRYIYIANNGYLIMSSILGNIRKYFSFYFSSRNFNMFYRYNYIFNKV